MATQQEKAKQTPQASGVASIEGTVNTKKAAEAAGLTELRFKTLAREGKVPSAQKDERGFWRYDLAKVTEWAANRPKRAGAKDGRRTFKVRLNPEEAEMVQSAIKDAGLELKPLNPPKKKQQPTEQAATPAGGHSSKGPQAPSK